MATDHRSFLELAPGQVDGRWTGWPDFDRLNLDDVEALSRRSASLGRTLDSNLEQTFGAGPNGLSDVVVETELPRLFEGATRSIEVTRSSVLAVMLQLALLGVLLTSFVLRRETLGSAFSSFVACAMIANATRHLYQAARVHASQRIVASTFNAPMLDTPSKNSNSLWTLFVALVLFAVNTVSLIPFLHCFVLMPALRSSSLALVALTACVAFGTYLVEIHGFRELKRRSRSVRQTQ